MAGTNINHWRLDRAHAPGAKTALATVLSFDVEEHFRIEAAARLILDPAAKEHYSERLEPSTRWLLEQLARHDIQATFFVVGQLARQRPKLIRTMVDAGHEVASHSWDHQRIHNLTPQAFREDVRMSKDALEQITGQPVLGYRAPTFSIVKETAWALDILAELGMEYDSSIYPVWHDRYGVPDAPHVPFFARGFQHRILELPPLILKLWGWNAPMGGGGYFRLFPLFLMRHAIRQAARASQPRVAMLYFHPWEFDPEQARLPLGRLNSFRTYVGISRARRRLASLLTSYSFSRAIDVARQVIVGRASLPHFHLVEEYRNARVAQAEVDGHVAPGFVQA